MGLIVAVIVAVLFFAVLVVVALAGVLFVARSDTDTITQPPTTVVTSVVTSAPATAPTPNPPAPAPGAAEVFDSPAAASCEATGGTVAVDARLVYCLGPEVLPLASSVESLDTAFGPSGDPLVELVFLPGAEGIDGFNVLAAECFAMAAACPTGLLAVVADRVVLSAPLIQAPAFERDQIVVSGNGNTLDLSDEASRSVVLSAEFRPVLSIEPRPDS